MKTKNPEIQIPGSFHLNGKQALTSPTFYYLFIVRPAGD